MSTRRRPNAEEQESLFEVPAPVVETAAWGADVDALGAELPRGIRLGTMSWTYPGWRNIVYGDRVTQAELTSHGLTAYSKYPLFRTTEIDRTYYEPLSKDDFATFAAQVPDDFRFVVKAHEDCVALRFPTHARYGKKRGELNARYLDPAYAIASSIEPALAGLGDKLGVLLFPFPPQDVGHPLAFADELHRFLQKLPKTVRYAVELRNAELLTRAYVRALVDTGVVHCHNAWTAMPDVLDQVRDVVPKARSPLVIRWLLRRGETYQDALARTKPFDKLIDENPPVRDRIANLVARADAHGVPVFVLVDNKAEGCAPMSIAKLADAIVRRQHLLHEG